jgi:hypothetical protein
MEVGMKRFAKSLGGLLSGTLIVPLLVSSAMGQSVTHFTISDIGNPRWWKPGEVTAGKTIKDVTITARKSNGNRDYEYDGTVYLSEKTNYGDGRIEPSTIELDDGRWRGTIRIYRSGKNEAGWGVPGDVWIEASDGLSNPHTGQSNLFVVYPEDLDRLIIILPGEQHVPGSVTGKAGTPTDQQAGTNFIARVMATDRYWNTHSNSVNHAVLLSSTGPAATLPPTAVMSNGIAHMMVRLNSAGMHALTAQNLTNGSYIPHTSSAITVTSQGLDHFTINPISSPRTAGERFPVIITAVDDQGNLVDDFNGPLDLRASTGVQTISPAVIQMDNGWWSGDITITKADPLLTISVSDRTSPPHTGESNQFITQAGQAQQLQVLLSGETATPGIYPGKTGSVSGVLSGTSLQVRVNAVDAWWNVNTNVSDIVHLSSTDGIAVLSPDASLSSGTKAFVVTLNSTGSQSITASDRTSGNVAPNTSSQVFVTPGNVDHFAFNPISGQATVGEPFFITVVAVDAQSNPIDSYSGRVSLSASSGAGTVLPSSIMLSDGVWRGAVVLTRAQGSVDLRVVDSATPAHSGTSEQFPVSAGVFSKVQILAPGMVARAGIAPGYIGHPESQSSGIPFQVTISAVDAYWNVVTSVTDSFAVVSSDPMASLPDPAVFVNGTRTRSVTLISSDFQQTISASAINSPEVSAGQTPFISVTPSDLDHYTISTIAGPVTAGSNLPVAIQAKTATGSRVYGFNGSVRLTVSTGEGTASPEVVGPFVNGEWAGVVVLRKADANVRLAIRDDSVPVHEGTSNAFTVLPGIFSKLQVLLPGEIATPGVLPGKSGLPSDQLTGVQFEVAVRAVDNHWNPVTTATDSVKVVSSDTLAIVPRSVLLNGKTTLTPIMGSAGLHTFTAIDITDSNRLSGLSSTFNVNPGSIKDFVFGNVSSQQAGDAFSVTITARDNAGSRVSGFNGLAKLFSTTDASTFSPSQLEFVDGQWNGQVIITKSSGNVKLSCEDFAASPHAGESNPFEVNPGPFTRLQILLPDEDATPGVAPGKTGDVKAQRTGDAFAITVNAVDDWWNPVPGAMGYVSLSSTDSEANLPLDKQLQSGSVSFSTFRFSNPGYWNITSRYPSNLQIISGTSPFVHVISGAVATFEFEAINSPQLAGDSIEVAIRAVDGGGETVTSYAAQASLTASTGPGTFLAGNIVFEDGTWTGKVLLTKAAQSIHLNIHDFSDIVRGNSNPFSLSAGPLSRVQILLAGETATPGLAPGKNGTPATRIAGEPFEFSVRATDSWWNPVQPDSVPLTFSATDSRAILPADTSQSVQQGTYTATLLTEGENALRVRIRGQALADTSNVFYVDSGHIHGFAFTELDSVQTAGKPFAVRIDAINGHGHPVTDYQGDIILSASTGNGTLSKTGVTLRNGFWSGTLYVTKAENNVVLFASDFVAPPNAHSGTSSAFTVVADTLSVYQVLLPGEEPTPGVEPGKREAPGSQQVGHALAVTVRAVDRFRNRIVHHAETLTIFTSDSFVVLPDSLQMTEGMAQLSLSFRAARKHCIGVRSVARTLAAYSDSVEVEPGPFHRLLTVLPGEELLPGDPETNPLLKPGKRNKAHKQTSGLPFDVRVYAVDEFFNPVVLAPEDEVQLGVTDENASISPASTMLKDGVATFQVTLSQGGNQVFTANNITDARIRSSQDNVVDVLVGGLHYEITFDETNVTAGEPFNMSVFFRNGVGENVASANHLVRLTAVLASDLSQETGTLANATFNLQAGQRVLIQSFDTAVRVRIKVEDDEGTEAAYSDPLIVAAGGVASFELNAERQEVRGLQESELTAHLFDLSGNTVSGKTVAFEVVSGSGEIGASPATSDSLGFARAMFKAGRITETNTVRVTVDSLSDEIDIIVNLTLSDLADGVVLNYPNPFGLESETTHFDYYLPEDADVTLRVFDLFGNLVWTKEISAGQEGARGRDRSTHPNSVEWNGQNDRGQKIGNGGYVLLARATANGKVVMNHKRKIVVLR